jgi:hypothetical protein
MITLLWENIKIKLFLLFVIIASFPTCHNFSPEKENKSADRPCLIDLEKNFKTKSVLLSSIGKKIEYIPLETTPNSVLGSLNGVGLSLAKIIFSDSFIFISDGEKLLQFDMSGKFIKQIGTVGRGPGQYLEPINFCIDEKKRNIYIINGRSVMEFDFNGHYKGSSQYEWPSVLFMPVDTGNFIFYISSFPVHTNNTVYSWYVTDLHCNPVSKLVNFHKRINVPGPRIGWTPLYSFNGNVHFMEFCADTLFFLKNGSPEPYALFNLGKMKMDPDPEATSDRRADFNRLNQLLWPRFINESDRCLFLTLWWGFSDSARYCVYNKQTLQTTFLKNNSFNNDIDGGPSFWPKYIYNDSILVDFIYADKFLKFINEKQSIRPKEKENRKPGQLEMLGKQLTETSNPVLIILK